MLVLNLALAAVALCAPQDPATAPPAQGQPPAARPGGQGQGKRPPIAPPQMPADVEPVTTTPSGLRYCVLTAGKPGESPKFGDRIEMHYSIWHADGAIIESTRATPKPVKVAVGDMIEGWNEALALMTPGARWKLTIPPSLGFGDRGKPGQIKPGETLVVECELFAFTKGPPLPPFHAGDPAKQKKTESGIVYEPITEGNGTFVPANQIVELKFAIWTPSGRLLDSSEKRGNNLKAMASEMPAPVLQHSVQYVSIGGRYRFEAPAEQSGRLAWYGSTFLPIGSPTIWEIEVVGIVEMPKFVAPDPTKQTTTASGLKYEVLKAGSGPLLKFGDHVTVHYSGWTADGMYFDSSRVKSGPLPVLLQPNARLIKGWIEGLQLMNAGAIFRFEIPPALGYGEQGRPPIPPNATLVFEMEIVQVGE